MFPIGDDQHHKGRFAPVTRLFLTINIIVFLHQASLSSSGFNEFIQAYGSIPALITEGSNLISLLTSMFLHGSWIHLIGNMLFLYVFGDNIEKELGSVKFVIFYIIGGVVASLTHIILDPNSTIPAVGASGAIAALLGAYIIWFPTAKIKMLIPTYGRIMYRSAKQFLGYWIVIQLVSGFGSLGGNGGGVAWWAHIGGFVFGVVVAYFSRAKSGELRTNKPTNNIQSTNKGKKSGWFGIDERV